METFVFWWSILTTLLSIIFLIVSIWQLLESKKQSERSKAQVKIWMHSSNGIHLALTRIVQDNLDKRYSSTNDIANAIWSVDANALYLHQSLYDERVYTEKEYKDEQKQIAEQIKQSQANNLNTNTSPKDNSPTIKTIK